ncbi:hypothetical protein, partial [Bacillus subtilis]|uniref:hypothetical protein n=1 Tax=Bacillus subtilis TaxID=1423 RepID=UPI001642B2D7
LSGEDEETVVEEGEKGEGEEELERKWGEGGKMRSGRKGGFREGVIGKGERKKKQVADFERVAIVGISGGFPGGMDI